MEPDAPSVLIVKLSALGDLFHALPVAEAIRRGLGARIDWVTQREYVEVVRCFSMVDRVIGFPRARFAAGAGAFLAELRERRYDLVIDLQGLFKSGLVTAAARGARKVGPSHHREGSRVFYHQTPPRGDPTRHAIDVGMDVARLLGVDPPRRPAFPVRFPECRPQGPRPWVALIPCSRWVTKNWPAERFAELGRRLQAETGGTLFVIGAAGDRPVCSAVAGAVPGARDLSGRTRLVELGGLLAAMDLVVSVDTGPMHMAAAVGTRVVAVFGATDPARTGPFGKAHQVVLDPGLACRPCRERRCPRGDLACLTRLSVDEVVRTAGAMLRREMTRQAEPS